MRVAVTLQCTGMMLNFHFAVEILLESIGTDVRKRLAYS
jgi:hypothetical protein